MIKWNAFHRAFIVGNLIWIMNILFRMGDIDQTISEILGYGIILILALVFSILLWISADHWKEQTGSGIRQLFLRNILVVLIVLEWAFVSILVGNSAGLAQIPLDAQTVFLALMLGVAGVSATTALYVRIVAKSDSSIL